MEPVSEMWSENLRQEQSTYSADASSSSAVMELRIHVLEEEIKKKITCRKGPQSDWTR